jgi:hypothetical protein
MDALNESHIQSKAKYYAISESKYSVFSASVDIGCPDPAPLCVTPTNRISRISGAMANPYAHDPDCDFWFDHYESECTCRRSGAGPARYPGGDCGTEEADRAARSACGCDRFLVRLNAPSRISSGD